MLSNEKLLELVKSKLAADLLSAKISLDYVEVYVKQDSLQSIFNILKNDQDLAFNLLASLTAVDYLDLEFMPRPDATRFELVYHFLNLSNLNRLRVKVAIPENKTEVISATSFWKGADFMESEVWDMYGISFKNHPNLRRVLMYPEFVGHPLRKDYPIQGKQPRVALRYPEVHNTARDMQRPSLVSIKKRAVAN